MAQTPAPIMIGESIQMHSKLLDEARAILVAKPAGYEKTVERYPVLYVLDGETHSSTLAPPSGLWLRTIAYRK